MKKKILIGSVLLIALSGVTFQAVGGISWLDSMGLRGDRNLVRSRVDAYWQARVAGDLEQQAVFVHPLQGSVPEPGMLVTEGFELHEVAIEGDEATAKLTVHSRLKHPVLSSRDRTIEMETKWVRYEGEWYKALAPNNIFEAIQNYQGQWTPPTAPPESIDETSAVQ